MKSLSVRTVTDVTLNEKQGGTGTITFGTAPFGASMYGGMSWPGVPSPPSFEMIPEARRVYNLILDAQREAR